MEQPAYEAYKGGGPRSRLLIEKKVEMSNANRVSEVRTSQNEPEREQRIFSFKATQLIWLAFGILEALIALRIGLMLVGANPSSPIVALIYGVTYLFLFPFTGLIGSPVYGNFVLELSSLFAMLVYALTAWAVERVVWLVFYRPHGPVVAITETTTSEDHHTTP
ncbi:MAG: YggT family protein [Chloroflexi bacterium]|nr:YggT family protein [Chloroflexota bacterium]